LALGVVSLGLLLAGLRISSSVSFTEPLQLQTSGAEYESLFTIWKYLHDMVIYNDRHAPPFNSVAYNWLFYQSYGAYTKVLLGWFNLSDQWLPSVSRTLTLIGAVATVAFSYMAFSGVYTARRPSDNFMLLAVALFIGTGPLIGFWIFTARPDIWSTVFEILGAVVFIRCYPARRWSSLLVVALCAYAAWAFKQGSIGFLMSIGLFLLIRMAWRDLTVMVIGMAAAFALTFAMGGPLYIKNVLFSGYPLEFTLERGIHNISFFLVKALPGVALFVSAIVCLRFDRRAWISVLNDDMRLFCLIAVFVTGGLSIPLSFQTGGAENYFFSFSFFVTLCGFSLMSVHNTGAWPRPAVVIMALAWLGLGFATLAILFGFIGKTDIHAQHTGTISVKECIKPLPTPVFIEHPYVSLPWMAPGEPFFVLSFVYQKERQLHREFSGDGIGGHIRRKEFKTLVLSGNAAPQTYDGALLDHYKTENTACPGYIVMTLKPIP